MKKIIVIAMLALVLITLFSGSALGDENYHGEDGEQPGEGVDDETGDGEPNPDTDPDEDRTRFKDEH